MDLLLVAPSIYQAQDLLNDVLAVIKLNMKKKKKLCSEFKE